MPSTIPYTPSAHLWVPQRRGVLDTIKVIESGRDACLFGPTGSGKTVCAIELFKWAAWNGWNASFYLNRKLLVGQTAQRFDDHGLAYGIRAADYEDMFDQHAPFQICSADTERSRVYKSKKWMRHDSQLVVVDEAHIQKGDTMREILEDHRKNGARVVLLTATPIGLSDWADELVVSGSLAEYRDCNAIVPAIVKSISQPDLRKIKRNATGEYVMDGEKRRIFTQSIVGDVVNYWKKFNPDAKPTMLYAPGKPESRWLTEQFLKEGVPWAHVDATEAMVCGKVFKLTRRLWEELLEKYKDGSIKGLSSRFKLREGIDAPTTYCCILATPIGSLASYIQTVGRVLRYSPETPDNVVVIDHGGNYWRHGSPNHDRPWKEWWDLPESYVSTWHLNQIKEKKKPEPICCPNCKSERVTGSVCPHCGFVSERSKRRVIMENGTMVEKDGHIVSPRRIKYESDTAEKWAKMYFGYKRKGLRKSFREMDAYFAHCNGYHPPRNIPFMPKHDSDWARLVSEVSPNRLFGKDGR